MVPRPAGAWRLIMLSPVASPGFCHPPIRNKRALADPVLHHPFPQLTFKTFSPSHSRVQVFWALATPTPCLSTPVFPGGLDGKESACNAGESGLIPGSLRSPGEGNGYPLWYSCLENPHGQRSLTGYSPWSCKESDQTQQPSHKQ